MPRSPCTFHSVRVTCAHAAFAPAAAIVAATPTCTSARRMVMSRVYGAWRAPGPPRYARHMSQTDLDVRVVKGACPHDCPDTCALETTVKNGVAIKVAGQKDHPWTDG